VHRQSALRGGARLVTRKRAEIGERRDQRRLILLQGAQREIAGVAEQAADGAGEMAMIDAQPLFRSLPTDRAHTALLRQQRVVFRRRYAVTALEVSAPERRVLVVLAGQAGDPRPLPDRVSVCLVIGTGALFDLLLVGLAIGSHAFPDLLLVCLVIDAIRRVLLCALVRVPRAPFPSPCVPCVLLFCV
jgi:hypothetical protein